MKPPEEPRRKPPRSLCETCRHVRRVESAKGSVFFLCRRSETEPVFRKYPPQPVVECRGFER
ncbi:MAG: hypothetical protein IPJ19_09370 [Planctomycetes bacterium]|nr:hypothetical protein [Planctomycetota bacterium]